MFTLLGSSCKTSASFFTKRLLQRFFLAVATASLALSLTACGGGGGHDIAVPSANQRADMLYGFYGTWGSTIAETQDFTNLVWDPLRDSTPDVIKNLQLSAHAAVIDLDKFIFVYNTNPRQYQPNVEPNIRAFFNELQAAGVLGQVRFVVPTDEPNLKNDNTLNLLPDVVAMIRRIVASYPELAGVKIGVIYAGNKPMTHIELFDVAGFDDYDAKSSVLEAGGEYDQMRSLMRPDQKTWLLVGGYKGQDPIPFLNFSNSHPEVIAIIPFLWEPPANEGFDGVGIRDIPAMRATYRALGYTILQKTPPVEQP